LNKFFNESLTLDQENNEQVEAISKGLLQAISNRDYLTAGVPQKNPMKPGAAHKDSLSRLSDAIKLFRHQINTNCNNSNEIFNDSIRELQEHSAELYYLNDGDMK